MEVIQLCASFGQSWLALLYLITFGSMVGFVAYIWLLQNAPVSLVATYAYVNPLVAVLLGSWFAQESLTATNSCSRGNHYRLSRVYQ